MMFFVLTSCMPKNTFYLMYFFDLMYAQEFFFLDFADLFVSVHPGILMYF